jgi:large subunit ribosomal protein L24
MSKKQMSKKQKIHVKIGDQVTVISGSASGAKGEVIKINRKTGKLIVQGINFKFKHVKPNTENEIGEIKQFEAPIHHSNVKLNLKEVS